MNNWRTISMEELWDYSNENKEGTFLKPKFPTSRWGQIYTKESTTNINEVNNVIVLLKEDGFTVRKRIEKKTNRGVFYKIEIKNHPEKIKKDLVV